LTIEEIGGGYPAFIVIRWYLSCVYQFDDDFSGFLLFQNAMF